MQELFSNNARTTLTGSSQPWASAPGAGTSESWQVASTGGRFPAVVTGTSQARAAIFSPSTPELDPEIVLITNTNDGTHFQVTRGAEGSTVHTHNAGDVFAAVMTKGSLAQFALLDSPAFTGIPTAPTAGGGTNTTQLATTAFVLLLLASPTFTGVPAAPTPGAGTNTTQIATTAFVQAAVAVLAATQALLVHTTQTASYTLVLGDAGTCVEMNVGSANNLTIPPNSSVAFPVDTVLEIFQLGAGQTTIAAGAGVTRRSDGAKVKIAGQYGTVSLRQRAIDEWVLSGDLA